jgi:hypothetical protein
VTFLRSSLCILIVSLLVLTGYAQRIAGSCCADEMSSWQSPEGQLLKQVDFPAAQDTLAPQPEHTHPAPVNRAVGDSCCQCMCHQVFSPFGTEAVRVGEAALFVKERFAHVNEFPPDALPLGIEYPPQLG